MALTLTYTGQTSVPVEIEGFTPNWAQGKSLAEIEQFGIFHGNEKLPLAEMFQIKGDPSDLRFDFEGNLSGVHWIGAQMREGAIHIHGSGGRHIGAEMCGGEIHVEGDAGGWVGAEMRDGLIHVQGNAGHWVGSAYRGSPKGMTGGTILIEGDAGNEIGLTMRRGMIAIGGRAGDMLGFNMIAGTVLVFGECGIRPGAGMRRGTLGLLGPNPPAMLPSFRYACTSRLQVLPLILKHLRNQGFAADTSGLDEAFEVFSGDLVSLGKGEIFVRRTGGA